MVAAEASAPSNQESPAPANAGVNAGSINAGSINASTNEYAQQWAAAAAMQNAYAYGVKPPDAGGAAGAMNGQSVTNQMNDATRAQMQSYYAQMAQNPNLYAQMWAQPGAFGGAAAANMAAYATNGGYGGYGASYDPSATAANGAGVGQKRGSDDSLMSAGDDSAGGRSGFPVPGGGGGPADERELKRQRRKQSNRESARRSRLRKQAECEALGSRVGGLVEENASLKAEGARLLANCEALSADNTTLRKSVVAAGGVVDTEAPRVPDGPTEEEKAAAAAAGKTAAAEAMASAKRAAALAAGDSDGDDQSPGIKEEPGEDGDDGDGVTP